MRKNPRMARSLSRTSASEPNASLVLRWRLELLSQDCEVANQAKSFVGKTVLILGLITDGVKTLWWPRSTSD